MLLWCAFALNFALVVLTGYKTQVYGRRYERWRVGSRMLNRWGLLYTALLLSDFMLLLWALSESFG